MSKLIADMSMSLDGRVATPTTTSAASPAGSSTATPRLRRARRSAPPRAARSCSREALGSVGAIIGGRRYFDLADGWGGRHPMGVPVYILTHEPPADWPADSTIHFVTDGLESAVAQAREAAGGKDIGVATPDVVRQCLDAGLLDELQVNLIPVVLGEGVPFFDGIAREVAARGPRGDRGHGRHAPALSRGAAADAGDDGAEATARQVTQAGRA